MSCDGFFNKMPLLKEILAQIDYLEFSGNPAQEIETVIPLDPSQQGPKTILWCSDKNLNLLDSIEQGAVICSPTFEPKYRKSSCHYLIVEHPRKTFQQIVKYFFAPPLPAAKIEKTAQVDPSAHIDPTVYLGHHVVIEAGVVIGAHTQIGHNTVIYRNTRIGAHVKIGSNNTIGNVGFGYEKNAEGYYEFIPHLGYVVIEDHVEIGNNTCIDRAVLGFTHIRKAAKIDNLVHIAHGVEIGENALIIANAMIAGSVKIGNHAWIAPSSSILNKITIGSEALIGLGAVVLRNVDNADIVVGNPAKSIKKKYE